MTTRRFTLTASVAALMLWGCLPNETFGTFIARLSSIPLWKPFALYALLQMYLLVVVVSLGNAYRLGKGREGGGE